MKVLPSLLLIFVCSFSFLLGGCASNDSLENYPLLSEQVAEQIIKAGKQKVQDDSYEVPDLSSHPHYVGPGNLFYVGHPSDGKLTGRYRVDFEGKLRLPYKVVIDVGGKTFSQVKTEVLGAYSKFFQKGVESVSVSLLRRDYWVEIRGLVKKPGRYLVKENDSLDLVLDNAGGVQGDLATEYLAAAIEQQKYSYKVLLNSYFEEGSERTEMRWLGGDTIFVSKIDLASVSGDDVPFVTVLGGVGRPGKVLFQQNAGLFYFLDKSGGVLPGLGYDQCFVFRKTPEGVKKIQFSFDEPGTIPVIYPGDTIYMNSDVRTDGDTWLDRLARVAAIISTAALLIIAL